MCIEGTSNSKVIGNLRPSLFLLLLEKTRELFRSLEGAEIGCLAATPVDMAGTDRK